MSAAAQWSICCAFGSTELGTAARSIRRGGSGEERGESSVIVTCASLIIGNAIIPSGRVPVVCVLLYDSAVGEVVSP